MCLLGTTICLLVVLMFMPNSADGFLEEMCSTKHPMVKCNKDIGGGTWYQLEGNRCVKAFYHAEHLTYWDAEAKCSKYKPAGIPGSLVSIHNVDQEEKVVCAMYKETTGKAHYWIGLFAAHVTIYAGFTYTFDAVYKWTDGTKHTYSKWHHGQPDFFRQSERCVEMNFWDWGRWNDLNCETRRPYVCAVRIA